VLLESLIGSLHQCGGRYQVELGGAVLPDDELRVRRACLARRRSERAPAIPAKPRPCCWQEGCLPPLPANLLASLESSVASLRRLSASGRLDPHSRHGLTLAATDLSTHHRD
jgi:hypothetical protein